MRKSERNILINFRIISWRKFHFFLLDKFTLTYNPKVYKKDFSTNNQHYLSLNYDFKAEQFVRLNVLPFIISTLQWIDSTDRIHNYLHLQEFSKPKYKIRQPLLSYIKIKMFLSDFLIFYRRYYNLLVILCQT